MITQLYTRAIVFLKMLDYTTWKAHFSNIFLSETCGTCKHSRINHLDINEFTTNRRILYVPCQCGCKTPFFRPYKGKVT